MKNPIAFATLLLFLIPSSAMAKGVECKLTEIHATNEKDPKKQGVDPKLEKHKKKLSKGPFAAWNRFRLLGETKVLGEKDKPLSAPLVPGSRLTMLLKDFVQSGSKTRIRMQIDMDSKSGKRIASMTVVFDDGDGVPIAGEAYKGGTYILFPICSAK